MGLLNTKKAAFAAGAAVVVVALAIAVAIGPDNNASVRTIDRAARGADPEVVTADPPTGATPGSVKGPQPSSRSPRAGGTGGGTVVLTPPAGDRSSGPVDRHLVPEGFRIGYRYSDPDSPSAVVISRFDFSDERTLFTAPPGAIYTAAEWSPNRDRILIGYCINRSPCSIRTVTLDGEASGVLDDGRRPSWSPDGRWILETKPGGLDRDELWVIPSGGGTAVKIGEAGGGCCGAEGRWSPDSTRIVWSDPQRHVLRVANRDGTEAKSYADPKDLLQNVSNSVADWSPNGESLTVERLVRDEQAEPNTAKSLLAIVNVKAARWQELGEWHGLEWSPDGQSVIVQRPKAVSTADRTCGSAREIGALTISDGSLRSFGDGCSAKLSPDRQMLAVAEVSRVRVIGLGTGNDRGVVVYESDGGFRSRGSQLLCCTWTPGNDALVLTDAEVVVVRIDGRARWQYR